MRPSEALHRPDTQDIGYEAPVEKPELLFDVQRDIAQGDIDQLRNEMDEWKETTQNRYSYSWFHCADMASTMHILKPDFFLARDEIYGLRAAKKKSRNNKLDQSNFAVLTSAICTFDPHYTLTEDDRQWMRANLEMSLNIGDSRGFSDMIRVLHDHDPTFDPRSELSAEARQMVYKRFITSRDGGDWEKFARWARALCSIDPDFQVQTEITASDRAHLRTFFLSRQSGVRLRHHWESTAPFVHDLIELDTYLQKPVAVTSSSASFPEIKKY